MPRWTMQAMTGKTGDDKHGDHIAGDRAERADGPGRHHAIDMRRFEPHERLPLLELSLATLEPGEALEVTFGHWPELLPRYLERTYPDGFEWREFGRAEEWCSLAIRRRTGTGGRR